MKSQVPVGVLARCSTGTASSCEVLTTHNVKDAMCTAQRGLYPSPSGSVLGLAHWGALGPFGQLVPAMRGARGGGQGITVLSPGVYQPLRLAQELLIPLRLGGCCSHHLCLQYEDLLRRQALDALIGMVSIADGAYVGIRSRAFGLGYLPTIEPMHSHWLPQIGSWSETPSLPLYLSWDEYVHPIVDSKRSPFALWQGERLLIVLQWRLLRRVRNFRGFTCYGVRALHGLCL